MRLRVVPLAAGVATAALATGFPASAADQTVNAVGTSWDKTSVSINVGETVTWANSSGLSHNICVAKPGGTPTALDNASCTEFRNGDPANGWSAPHMFTTAGTYSFICQAHPFSMAGTVTVGGGGGGTTTTDTGTGTTTTSTSTTTTSTTGTSTSTTQTQTTATETTPTQTQTQTAADTTAPAFTGKLRRRANRRSLVIELGSSEDATLKATVFRRAPRARSFSRGASASLAVHAGRNVVTLPRRAGGSGRSGSYRVTLQLVDAAGNKSGTRTLRFKLA